MRGGDANGNLYGIIYFCNNACGCYNIGSSDKEINRPELVIHGGFIS
jgi:hypothetical protein